MFAVVAGAAIGAGAAIYSASQSANATEDAANKAANSQNAATASQERMYNQQRQDYQPFYALGTSAAPWLQSAVLGGPVQYSDPRYQKMSVQDINSYNASLSKKPLSEAVGTALGLKLNQWNAYALDPNATYYRAPDGSIQTTAPTLTANYNPATNPMAQYQLQEGTKAFNRAAASRGLSGGGQAVTGLGDLGRKTAAESYQQGINNLTGLVNIGRGASETMGNAGNTLSSAYGAAGNNNAQYAYLGGQGRASLYAGIPNAVMSSAGLGLNAYKALGGGGGGSNSYGYDNPYTNGGNTYFPDYGYAQP